ncbi:hypothetical protein KY348_07285 [Candidatus Woesearchaeota archaeon]|nr:hypothetical protein [Candidatus Woesearchaeota archaeon]
MGKSDEKKKAPEHIEKYYKLSKKAKKLVDTTDLHHREAYDLAVNKTLLGKDNLVDYDILKEDKKQDEFAGHMADYYIGKAKDYFKSDISGKDEFENEMLMNAYTGTTRSQLKQMVNRLKERFKFDVFNKHKEEELMGPLKERLEGVARGHLNREHINDIVDYTGAGDIVKKENLDLNHAVGLLNLYDEQGIIPKKGLEKAGFRDYHLKKKDKKYKK